MRAMLYKMEATVRLGYTSLACKDLPYNWKECFIQNIQPSPVSEIKFYKQASKGKLKKSSKKLKIMPEAATVMEQEKFLSSLADLLI